VTLPAGGREGAGPLPAAFERLFRGEYARVVGIAQRVLGDQGEAEDVAQDVFMSFYRAHPADDSRRGNPDQHDRRIPGRDC